MLLLTACLPVTAQQSNTFYLMHQVPQSGLLNPAVQLKCRYFIGFPVLGSSHLAYSNTAFTYNDVADGDTWDMERVAGQVHREDLYRVEADLLPVSLGYRHRSLYFTFHISERFTGYQTLPGKLVRMGVFGNAGFAGETVSLRGFRTAGYHIRTYSAGVSRRITPYLTAGIRGNLLFGKSGLSTGRSQIALTTREDNFSLRMDGEYTLNGSFPADLTFDAAGNVNGIDFDPETFELRPYLLNRRNPGFSLDAGIIYQWDEYTTLSASILDVGFLAWRSETKNVHGEGAFVFEGGDLSTELISAEFLEQTRDSVINAFDFTPTEESFRYFLPPQVFLGVSHRITPQISAGLVNRNLFFRRKWHASFTASVQAELAERFTAVASWSYLNRTLKNVGLGLAYHGNGFQVHAVTDNLIGFFYPFDTRTLNLRAGFGLMLGCPRNRREQRKMEGAGHLPGGGVCPYPENPRKEKKRRMRAIRKQNRI